MSTPYFLKLTLLIVLTGSHAAAFKEMDSSENAVTFRSFQFDLATIILTSSFGISIDVDLDDDSPAWGIRVGFERNAILKRHIFVGGAASAITYTDYNLLGRYVIGKGGRRLDLFLGSAFRDKSITIKLGVENRFLQILRVLNFFGKAHVSFESRSEPTYVLGIGFVLGFDSK